MSSKCARPLRRVARGRRGGHHHRPPVHSNGVSGSFIGGTLGEMLNQAGLAAYAGPPTGYVLTFSNGLTVYLSGDTGITAEQDSVVRRH